MKIGFDIDGVLADFNASYIDRVVKVTGRDLFPARPFDIPCWDYPQYYGYTEEETRAVWDSITTDPTFWLNLSPYSDAQDALFRLRELSTVDDVYFVTSRPGILAKHQSEVWLATHSGDFMWNPTVLIASDKGAIAEALRLDAYIDDRWENCVDAREATQVGTRHVDLDICNTEVWYTYTYPCKVFCLDRPWNQDRSTAGISRVQTIAQAMMTIDSRREVKAAA